MRRLSLNARLASDAPVSGEIEVVLLCIEHPELTTPIRLSTDNVELLSVEPRYYGTRSAWRGGLAAGQPYLWVMASALLPSDLEDAPAAASIVVENLDARMAQVLRSFTTPATVHLAVVLASTPDLVEAEFSDLMLVSAEIDAGQIVLSISREEIEQEMIPGGRMSRERFPGLHR